MPLLFTYSLEVMFVGMTDVISQCALHTEKRHDENEITTQRSSPLLRVRKVTQDVKRREKLPIDRHHWQGSTLSLSL